jgi:hypothetical protein
MMSILAFGSAFLLGATAVVAPRRGVRREGTVKRVDSSVKTMVVTVAAGTKHTLQFLDRTAVHGVHEGAASAKEGLSRGEGCRE